jgi:GNAT superfamily N-acetyltransferase
VRMLREKLRPAGRLSLARARPEDAPSIGRILSDWIDETDWMVRIHKREDEQRFAAELVARGWVTVARRGGTVVGFLARDGADVVALYVDGPARGRGVGAALLARAKKKSRRLELWTFQFNHAARAFYERHGFAELARTGGAGNDEKLPDIKYLWEKTR